MSLHKKYANDAAQHKGSNEICLYDDDYKHKNLTEAELMMLDTDELPETKSFIEEFKEMIGMGPTSSELH